MAAGPLVREAYEQPWPACELLQGLMTRRHKVHCRPIGMSQWEISQAMQQAERHQGRDGPEGCQCLQHSLDDLSIPLDKSEPFAVCTA
jgi:hypothetical protein